MPVYKKIVFAVVCTFLSAIASSCSSAPSVIQTSTPEAPVSYKLSGTITGVAWLGTAGIPCDLNESLYYKDLGIGSQVKMENAKGEVVALGKVVSGSTATIGGQLQCVMEFSVNDIPESNFYSVVIGNNQRGKQTYSKDDLASKKWSITLSLGGK